MWSLKHWLARLSFSMLILTGLLLWSVWKAVSAGGWSAKPVFMVAGAAVAFGLGIAGVRLRHGAPQLKDFQDGVR